VVEEIAQFVDEFRREVVGYPTPGEERACTIQRTAESKRDAGA
jgi:hypothetical protein